MPIVQLQIDSSVLKVPKYLKRHFHEEHVSTQAT